MDSCLTIQMVLDKLLKPLILSVDSKWDSNINVSRHRVSLLEIAVLIVFPTFIYDDLCLR